MGRKAARENAFKLCFQAGFYAPGELDAILEKFFSENKLDADEKEYIGQVVPGVFEHAAEIEELIGKTSEKWSTERMGRVDMAIMRVCVYELLTMDDIPESVSINEAVELAKRYGADDSPAFINGVLSGVNKAIGNKNR